jgi:acetylornithine/succinyldiaminopimelate/putrescine aminotransferase
VRFVALNDVEGLRAAVDDNTCALVLEPVQGEGGIRACSKEFLQAARSVADQHGATLIFDEIQCGLGRTGALFAFQHFGVSPDVVTIAKPLAAGLPLGAFLASDKLAQVFTPGIHGTTFGGGPLACRVALEYLQIVEDENLLEHVQKVGAFLHSELAELARRSKVAESARGIGMMQALQLNVPGRPIVEAALQHGMLFNSTQDTVLRFLPPFLMTETQIKKGMRVLRRLLREQSK